MKTKKTIWLLAVLLFALSSPHIYAGDNLETITDGGAVISPKLWDPAAFPLSWQLHEDGVITNDALGLGTLPVSNANATTEIGAAFQLWQDLALSTIIVAAGAETPVGDIGCDLVNVVTWSDTVDPFAAGSSTIARGVTTTYVGPDIVLTPVNRNIQCGDSAATVPIALPVATYPDGMTLFEGTILDMDMTWNPGDFDYVITPNATFSVLDIRAVAAHEFGHMFGFSHTSLAFTASDPVTMFPIVSSSNITLQNNMRTLEPDEDASAGRGYPDVGFYPTGAGPFTTGAITGHITEPGGAAATGVRVWAYNAADTTQPVYETFSVTSFDWDPALTPGDYVLDGLAPGDYFICILPWSNDIPTVQSADPARYNLTTNNGVNNTGFGTECYDDAASADLPDFAEPDLVRTVTVTAGDETPKIDFITGTETTDFILVMDRSGSMGGSSGTAGVSKLQALQNSANAFIDFLDIAGAHNLGLVQFNAAVVPLAPIVDLQALNAASVADAHTAINAMVSGGMTNIISGIEEGIDQLTTIAAPAPRQVMLVFSDGKHNRPVGSDLNDMHDPVVDNDILFYSIGFGTSVNDVILTDIAVDSGGIHVNEQDLAPVELSKLFISIAASATDMTTLIDPRYDLGPSDTAKLNVGVSADETELTFVVIWGRRDENHVTVKIRPPGRCKISGDASGPGYTVRKGETYKIVNVPVPFKCRNRNVSGGVWRVSATTSPAAGGDVQMMVYGRSSVRLAIETAMTGWGPMVFAKLQRNGRMMLPKRITAELVRPLKATNDSEKQDEFGTKYCSTGKTMREGDNVPDKSRVDERCLKIPDSIPREKRTSRFSLYDDGTHGDAKAGDGIFSAVLPLKTPGPYYLRVIADDKKSARNREKTVTTQEQWTSFYYDGKRIIGTKLD